jgi:hypothetical protein
LTLLGAALLSGQLEILQVVKTSSQQSAFERCSDRMGNAFSCVDKPRTACEVDDQRPVKQETTAVAQATHAEPQKAALAVKTELGLAPAGLPYKVHGIKSRHSD